MTISYETTTNTPMFNNNNNITEKSSSRFSYLIRPTTPCIFGTENYDDKSINDDEFFVTAGGIVHSCPNIYELAIENTSKYHRKLQSCEHFMFISKPTTSSNTNLNIYDTKFDRYSITPRFQPISSSLSSLSTDSINSEIELYKERHASGLSRKHDNTSFLPTTWKSDDYLLFMSVQSSIDNNKRSHSFSIPIGQTISSVFVVLS
jgi:hypothetical protein